MFSFNKKIDPDLKAIMALYPNKNHRILIKYAKFPDFIVKKVSSYKGIIVRKIEKRKKIFFRYQIIQKH